MGHTARLATLAAIAAITMVLLPAAAGAHPAFDPAEIAPGEQVPTELVIPHGCQEADHAGPGSATTRVDVPAHVGVDVDPSTTAAWQGTVAQGTATWVHTDAGQQGPFSLPVTLTVAHGQAGERLYLQVSQECADGQSIRWVAGPDEPGDPAAHVELTADAPTPTPAPTSSAASVDRPVAADPHASADGGDAHARTAAIVVLGAAGLLGAAWVAARHQGQGTRR